ncbi:MAG: flagellar hook-basal body complex protein [Planctomycetota bacterium]
MPSTTALLTGLSGLNANARSIDVIGNNIANVNTPAFKSSRVNFENQFSRTVSIGTEPGSSTGGTNPYQVGLGVQVSGTQRDMSDGSVSATGDARDLAIEGAGFFTVRRGDGTFYTRAGAFRQDQDGALVTPGGERLQGFGVDENYNVVEGVLQDITIPIGALTIAEATQNVNFTGNLDADGERPTQGSLSLLTGIAGAGLTVIGQPAGANLMQPGTPLVQLEDPEQVGAGAPLFAVGQRLEVRGVEKGGGILSAQSLEVTATTTAAELAAFLNDTFGIQDTGANPDGRVPGVVINGATGAIEITGNTGTANSLSLDPSDLRVLNADGTLARLPFEASNLAESTGESVRTTFIAYDSLGAPLEVDITLTLDGASNTGTRWRYYVESPADSDAAIAVATGTLDFDTQGQLLTPVSPRISIDRAGTGAVTPLTFDLNFSTGADNVTALADSQSSIAATFRDGAPRGDLASFGVGPDGVITGAFSNGLTRTLGQVPLSMFRNPEGLVDDGSNLFSVGANSGPAVTATAGTLGAGSVIGGAIETSNVDLGAEFIGLISAQTGYSASSRVIRTADELIQQLLVIGR